MSPRWNRAQLLLRNARSAPRRHTSSGSAGGGAPGPKDAAPAKTAPSSSAAEAANPTMERMHSRLPKFLRPYTEGLRRAPVSHITSFLILHELTAVIPLIGIGWYLYRADELPWYAEGKIFNDGIKKFGNYFRKKGWLGEDSAEGEDGQKIAASTRWKWWGRGEGGVKLVTSAAAAYTLTKMLLPIRLVFSVWLTPLFARTTLIPMTRGIKNLFRRKKS